MDKSKFDKILSDLGRDLLNCQKEVRSKGSLKIHLVEELLNKYNDLILEYKELSEVSLHEMNEGLYIVVESDYGNHSVGYYKDKKELISKIQSGQLFGKWKLMKEVEIKI